MVEKQIYNDWLEQWLLLNPKPVKEENNKLLFTAIISANISMILLAGSRTFVAVSSTETFLILPKLIGLPTTSYPFFIILEGILSILGFEGVLFISGYLGGEFLIKSENVFKWYVWPSIITVLLANLLPVMNLIGLEVLGLRIVSTSVGISAVILSFVGGYVVKTLKDKINTNFTTNFKQWQKLKKDDWKKEQIRIKAKQTRDNRRLLKKDIKKDVVLKNKVDVDKQIIDYLSKNNDVNVSLLVREVNADTKKITESIEKLVKTKKIKIFNGSGVKLA